MSVTSQTGPPGGQPGSQIPPAVRLTGITKRYPGVVANSDINFSVRRSTVHALVGENGAGKSTLMKTLYGMHQPDEGTIEIDGQPRTFHSPADAIAAGIGMVHQHFMLADNLTVWENIVLGVGAGQRCPARRGGRRAHIAELGRRYGLAVDPAALVETLGVGARQRVEILKVLYRGAQILILDEPTAVLVPQEVDELFGNLRELKAEGLTIIFISHKLDEVRAISDEITVIRRGTTVGTADPTSVTNRQLAEMMVGSALPVPELRESTVTDTEVLTLEHVTVAGAGDRDLLHDISLTIHAGEVLGIAGVEGNGQAELVDAMMGILPLSSGTITLGGVDITAASTLATARGGRRVHPRGSAAAGAAAGGTAVGEPHPRPPDQGAVRQGRVPQSGGRPGGHPKDRRRLRRADPGHRRVGGRPVRRQPAEAHRRPRDERRSGAAHRCPPDPRCRRRRPGGDLGTAARGPRHRARRPADLRGPRGADRHVGHPVGDPSRSAGRQYDPHSVTPQSLGGAMTGAGREDLVHEDDLAGGIVEDLGVPAVPDGEAGDSSGAIGRGVTIVESPASDAETGGAATRREL